MANTNNATYVQSIPSLEPLQSGCLEVSAESIEAGTQMSGSHIVAASRQYRTRKQRQLLLPGLVADEELVAAKRRKHAVQSAQFDGQTPRWAQQLQFQMGQMQTQLNQVQTQLNQVHTQMGQMMSGDTTQLKGQLQQTQRLIQIESQRSRNYARHTNSSTIAQLVRDLDGRTPRDDSLWFPTDYKELFQAPNVQVNPLLTFYGLDLQGTLSEKRNRLADHLGVVL